MEGDLVITMGAGTIGSLPSSLVATRNPVNLEYANTLRSGR